MRCGVCAEAWKSYMVALWEYRELVRKQQAAATEDYSGSSLVALRASVAEASQHHLRAKRIILSHKAGHHPESAAPTEK
jgi:hypothetical protein